LRKTGPDDVPVKAKVEVVAEGFDVVGDGKGLDLHFPHISWVAFVVKKNSTPNITSICRRKSQWLEAASYFRCLSGKNRYREKGPAHVKMFK
jgi:hypothetical protein